MKRFIQDFRIAPKDRSSLVFSDPTKVRLYSDPGKPGVRLRAFANVPAQKMEFPVDLGDWREKSLATLPAARKRHAMAYDISRRVWVLFGGEGSGGRLADTLEYNGIAWSTISPATSPIARDGAVMVYDSVRKVIVLFGGETAGGLSAETWEYDGITWTEITPATTTPSARKFHGIIYDSLRSQLVMFGGLTGSGESAETWTWTGLDWTLLETGPTELARRLFGMVFDSDRGFVVVFGGHNGTSVLGDTWNWSLIKGWFKRTIPESPPPRMSMVMIYDEQFRKTVLFGGDDGTLTELGETWEYDGGSKWEKKTPTPSTEPDDRYESAAAYASDRRYAVMFGGEDTSGLLVDHWEHLAGVGNTVKLKRWSPASVKQWLTFQEVSETPDGTSVLWQIENATTALWFDGVAWVTATAFDWNTEDEIADNLATLPIVDKTIRPVVRLFTVNRFQTPVLTDHKIMISGDFNSWGDFLDSLIKALENASSFEAPIARKVVENTTTFNLKTDPLWKPAQAFIITDVIAVYNHITDPNHDTNILSSYDTSTGDLVLTVTVPAGEAIWVERDVSIPVIGNYPNSEYIEVSQTPAIIIDTIQAKGTDDTSIKRDLAHKSMTVGHRMENPILLREVLLTISLHAGFIEEWTSLLSIVHSLPKRIGNKVNSTGLDVDWSISLTARLLTYNPKPTFSDLKTAMYELCVKDVFMWVSDIKDLPIVKEWKPTIKRKEVVGPFATSGPKLPPAGQIVSIQPLPIIETG